MLPRHAFTVALVAAGAADAQPVTLASSGNLSDAVQAFAQICVTAPADIAVQRAAISASPRRFRRAPAGDGESYTAWPLRITISEEAGWVQCYVSATVAPSSTMAQALDLVRPLAGPGAGETLTGDYAAWERFGEGGFSMRLNLSTVAAGKTAVLSIAARKAG